MPNAGAADIIAMGTTTVVAPVLQFPSAIRVGLDPDFMDLPMVMVAGAAVGVFPWRQCTPSAAGAVGAAGVDPVAVEEASSLVGRSTQASQEKQATGSKWLFLCACHSEYV